MISTWMDNDPDSRFGEGEMNVVLSTNDQMRLEFEGEAKSELKSKKRFRVFVQFAALSWCCFAHSTSLSARNWISLTW